MHEILELEERVDEPIGELNRCLVVFVPALWSEAKDWNILAKRLEEEPEFQTKKVEWFLYKHKLKGTSRGELEEYGALLRNEIEAKWITAEGFDEIILVGKSIGGLIARQSYLIASGVTSSDGQTDEWSTKVSRIILIAGLNRGLLAQRNRWLRWALRFCRLSRLVGFSHWIVQDLAFGSAFLTNLRINWIRHFGALEKKVNENEKAGHEPVKIPTVIQVLGDKDTIVKQDDSKDILAFQSGVQLIVPGATHRDILNIYDSTKVENYPLLKNAFCLELEQKEPEKEDENIKRVVFLLHGIRSFSVAQWQNQLEEKIVRRDPDHTKVIRPSYGYFTGLNFVRTSVRNRYARMMQDWYVDTLAKYPTAEYHAIAHSNGSYILGYSMERISGIKFKNVILAGSVLPENFKWAEIAERGQVDRIRNHRSSYDWPVGILCKALNGIGVKMVGTGGFTGFKVAAANLIEEMAFYPGGHSSALKADNQKHFVDYLYYEEQENAREMLLDMPRGFTLLSNLSKHMGLLILLGLGSLIWVANVVFGLPWFLIAICVAAIFLLLYLILDVI